MSSHIEGIVSEVDPVSREVLVMVNGAPQSVYVPPDCRVLLRGEPVKLRIMQPRDRVRLRAQTRAGSLVAQVIEVRTDCRRSAS